MAALNTEKFATYFCTATGASDSDDTARGTRMVVAGASSARCIRISVKRRLDIYHAHTLRALFVYFHSKRLFNVDDLLPSQDTHTSIV